MIGELGCVGIARHAAVCGEPVAARLGYDWSVVRAKGALLCRVFMHVLHDVYRAQDGGLGETARTGSQPVPCGARVRGNVTDICRYFVHSITFRR